MNPACIRPDWPAPARVRAASSTRLGGVSQGVYASLNLGAHVGDAAAAVAENRRRLAAGLELPGEPLWLNQVHGCSVAQAGAAAPCPEADAAIADRPGRVCAVMTADCLPVLLCDDRGERVSAVHAGWRGLCGGVIERAVQAMQVPGERLLAWLGPAIGPGAFEVGEEVRQAFVERDADAAAAFCPSPRGRWLADLYALARRRLARVGVNSVHGGGFCTLSDSKRFFSFRRDGVTGRMASLIWIQH